jgi:hypothetical protein
VSLDGVLDWIIGFIDHCNTQLVITLNYSAVANLHILEITTTPAKSFPAGYLHKPFPGNSFYQWRFFSFTLSGPLFSASLPELNSQLTLSPQLPSL